MPTDDRTRAEQLFLDALEASPAERDRLVAACPDAAVRAEVGALLAAAPLAEAFFARLPDAPVALLDAAGSVPADDTDALSPGARVGPWTVGEAIGRGGMGTVFRAERADGLFRQTVALKVIRRGMDTDDVLARFVRERAVLAELDHPRIARLVDGGTAPDGRPYFAMELVEGEPLLAWADRHRLDLDARLDLFLQVCDAVAYAHRRLVVHRDLKPTNVLVAEGDAGQPGVKLLDFGLAKVLDASASDDVRTSAGRRLLTPAYAAPEQFDGRPVTTATDVYALGVLLHELLTGRRPPRADEPESTGAFGGPSRPSATVRQGSPRLAGERTPAAGSVAADARASNRGTTPVALARRLRGDLDAILQTALRPEPEARYPSVDAFADDLRRHLGGLPVRARAGTARYHATAFVRRHRLGVGLAALLVLVLAGSAAALAIGQRATARERDRAEAVSAFLVDLFRTADPSRALGDSLTARGLLDEGAARVARLDADDATRARLEATLGEAYTAHGLPDHAVPLLTRALAAQRRVGRTAETAATLAALGEAHRLAGRLDAAEAAFREALSLRREAPDTLRAASEMDLAAVLISRGDFDGARGLLARAHARVRRAGQPVAEARILAELGTAELAARRLDAADRYVTRALALRRRHLPPEHPDFYNSLHALGTLRYQQHQLPEAERLLREAIALQRRVRPDDFLRLAAAENDLALVQRARGDFAGAERSFRSVVARYQRHSPDNAEFIGVALHNLAWTLKGAGRLDEAAAQFHAALAASRTLGPRHFGASFQLLELGRIALMQGRPADAERLLAEAASIRRDDLAPDDWLVVEADGARGQALLALGRRDEAEPLLRAYHAGARRQPLMLPDAARALAQLLRETGRAAEAARVLRDTTTRETASSGARAPRGR